MVDEKLKVFKEYTWSLIAYLNIDVHRTFYKSIKENEEITLNCNNKERIELTTSKGTSFIVFANRKDEYEYFYYAIKSGAIFKGCISNVDGKGSFNIHISQYVTNDYEDPKKKVHTESFTNPGLGKTYYRSSMRYEQDVKEEKGKMNLYLVVTIIFFLLLFTVGSLSSSVAIILIISFILFFLIEALVSSSDYYSDSDLKNQIRDEEKARNIKQKSIENFSISNYDSPEYDIYGFNKYGYNKLGYDINGFNRYGYDSDGFDKSGFNKFGFNRDGIHKNGTLYNSIGYDINGYDKNGFDECEYNVYGYNKDGYNKSGQFNELIGKKVYHISCGKGIITGFSEKDGIKYFAVTYEQDFIDGKFILSKKVLSILKFIDYTPNFDE